MSFRLQSSGAGLIALHCAQPDLLPMFYFFWDNSKCKFYVWLLHIKQMKNAKFFETSGVQHLQPVKILSAIDPLLSNVTAAQASVASKAQ